MQYICFTKSLKQKNTFSNKKQSQDCEFAILCFSLMVNCTDLKAISNIFMLICTCFATTGKTATKARETLQKLIEKKLYLTEKEKYSDKTKSNFSEEQIKIMTSLDEYDSSKDVDVHDVTESFLDVHNVPTVRQSIRNQSLFNQHFIDIAENVLSESVSHNEQENLLFNPKFVEFLLEYFMPYCGIWAGFVFQEIQTKKQEEFARITNGLTKDFWQYRKNKFKVAQQTATFVISTLIQTKGQATAFVDNLEKDSAEEEETKAELEDIYAHKYCWDIKTQSNAALEIKQKTNIGQLPKTIKRFKTSDDNDVMVFTSATTSSNKETMTTKMTIRPEANV